MREGLTQAAFAKLAKCSVSEVKRALATGRLSVLEDGSLDRASLKIAWRRSQLRPHVPKPPKAPPDPNAPKKRLGRPPKAGPGVIAGEAPTRALIKVGEAPEHAAHRVVNVEGRAPYTIAEAARIKENFLALLRQLEYDEKAGSVVPVADVKRAVSIEYGIVRSRIISIAAEVAPRIAFLKEASEVQAFLEAEISKVLNELTLDDGRSSEETVSALRARSGS